MYISVRNIPSGTGSRPAGRVAKTVVVLGMVSLLTDISTEIVTAVLPLFVTVGLGLPALAFGVLDSVYQAGTAAARVAGGYVADRSRRPKAVAVVGYGLGVASKALLLPAAGVVALSAAIGVDRVGKGLRTGPRDALIAGCSEPGMLGRSFGVHRALDTLGAAIGPLAAFYLLMAMPGDFDAVFTVSLCVGGLGVLLLVSKVAEAPRAPRPARITLAGAGRLLAGRRQVRRLLVAATALSALTVSDAFLYLALLDRGAVPAHLFPLLFLGTSVVYLAAAVPFGRLADRLGRRRVFVAGHVAVVAAYGVTGLAGGAAAVVVTLALLGLYYAATDGVLPAATSVLVPAEWRATAISALQTGVALGRSLAALAFGGLWTLAGPSVALGTFAAGLAVVLLAVAPVLLRTRSEVSDA